MPNYKLKDPIKSEIKAHVRVLLKRRLDTARLGFPLTVEEIQAGLMTEEQMELVHRLEASGYRELRTHNLIQVLFERERIAGLQRSVVMMLGVGEAPLHLPLNRRMHHSDIRLPEDAGINYHIPTLTLSHENQLKVSEWVNNVVRERRMGELTTWAVDYVLKRVDETYPLLAWWPQLATFIKDPVMKHRIRHAAKRLTPYMPNKSSEAWAMVAKEIAAGDVILAGASFMLDNVGEAIVPPVGTMQAWEFLPTDKFYEPVK